MKGRELIDNVVRGEMPDIEKVRREVHQAAPRKHAPLRLVAMAAVAVAVVCLLVGSLVWSPQSNNSFSVKAYATEGEAEGSISLRDHWIDPSHPGTIFFSSISPGDGYDYMEIFLECEGENIKTVEFIAEGEGAFGIARFEQNSFEPLGNSFILEGGKLAEDEYLYVGKPGPVKYSYLPVSVTIRAIATFNDGTTQEKTLSVHLFGL